MITREEELTELVARLRQRVKETEAERLKWRRIARESVAAYNELSERYALLAYKDAGYKCST